MKHYHEWLLVIAAAALMILVKHLFFSDGSSLLFYTVDLFLLLGLGVIAAIVYRSDRSQREQEEVYKLLRQFKYTLDLTLDCVFMFDPDTLKFTYVNDGAIRQVGYTETELLEMTPLDIKPEFTEARFREMVAPLLRSGEKHLKFETLHRHKNGRLIPVEIVLQYVALEENAGRFIAIVRDVSKRRETEADLTQSQQSLQLFFEQSLDGIFFMMLDKPIVWNAEADKEALLEHVFGHEHLTKLNQAMARQYGYSVREMLGRTPQDFFAANIEYGKQLWRELFDAGRLATVSKEHRADGMQMWIEGDYICLYDDEGRITGHFGIQRDITVKKMALDELMESEKRLELSIESAGQGTWEWNIQTGQVIYGGMGAKLLGYDEGELTPSLQTWQELLHPEDRDAALASLQEHVENGELYRREYRLRAKDGSYKWVLSTGKVIDYDEEGKPLRMAGIHMNIDERKRNELRLELSIEGANQGTWDWNIKTGEVVFGGKWAEMIGYEADELPSTFETFEQLVYPEDMEMVKAALDRHFEDGSLYRVAFRMKTKDGTLRWIMATGRVIEYDSDGTPMRMAGTHTDIDEMKRLQLQLRELNANLEARVAEAVKKQREQEKLLIQQSRMAGMGEMISEIAHQWRQPLNAIGLMIQLLQSRMREGELSVEEMDELIEKGKSQLQFMSQTIDDFRNFFKPLKASACFNVVDAVMDVVHIMAPQMDKLGIGYDLEFWHEREPFSLEEAASDSMFMIEGYQNEFKQVVLNVLSNAKDAIEEHQEKAGPDYHGHVGISLTKRTGALDVTIVDNGGGIPESVLERIFEPYFTTKPDDRGTGIGLYMSKIIMERYMNGTIKAGNILGGAKFEIEVQYEARED